MPAVQRRKLGERKLGCYPIFAPVAFRHTSMRRSKCTRNRYRENGPVPAGLLCFCTPLQSYAIKFGRMRVRLRGAILQPKENHQWQPCQPIIRTRPSTSQNTARYITTRTRALTGSASKPSTGSQGRAIRSTVWSATRLARLSVAET